MGICKFNPSDEIKKYDQYIAKNNFFASNSYWASSVACATLIAPSSGTMTMHSTEYSLPDTLERIYENQLALEAALMDLT